MSCYTLQILSISLLLICYCYFQVIRALQRQHRTQTQWTNLVEKIIHVEDVHRNVGSHERYFKASFDRARPAWQAWIYGPTLGSVFLPIVLPNLI